MLKKIISVLLIMCTCLCFSACNNTDDDFSVVSAPEEEAIKADEILYEEPSSVTEP